MTAYKKMGETEFKWIFNRQIRTYFNQFSIVRIEPQSCALALWCLQPRQTLLMHRQGGRPKLARLQGIESQLQQTVHEGMQQTQ